MQRLDGGAAVPESLAGGIVALGNFDGFHLGHQAVVGRAVARARAEGRPALVATFDPPGDMWTAVDLLAVELATGFDSLDEPLEAVMTGTMGLVAGLDSLVAGLDSLAAGFDALDDAFETVMKGTMGLVADDTMGAVEMLNFELAGHLDDLEDISGTLGT